MKLNRISVFVREQRIRLGMTQEEMAKLLGVGFRFYRELESGKETLMMNKVNQVLNFFGKELAPMDTSEKKIIGVSETLAIRLVDGLSTDNGKWERATKRIFKNLSIREFALPKVLFSDGVNFYYEKRLTERKQDISQCYMCDSSFEQYVQMAKKDPAIDTPELCMLWKKILLHWVLGIDTLPLSHMITQDKAIIVKEKESDEMPLSLNNKRSGINSQDFLEAMTHTGLSKSDAEYIIYEVVEEEEKLMDGINLLRNKREKKEKMVQTRSRILILKLPF